MKPYKQSVPICKLEKFIFTFIYRRQHILKDKLNI